MRLSIEDVLRDAELSPEQAATLVVGTEVDVVPDSPSHRWIVLPSSRGGIILGGRDRGWFAPYAELADRDGAVDALRSVLSAPELGPAPLPTKGLVHATQVLADQLRAQLADHALPGSAIPVGAVLDHVGPECGHVLYLLNTPMSQRSLPPTDLNEQRTGYVVARPLPEATVVEVVPPWFGQPGGGIMVRLPYVIRALTDAGVLTRFDPSAS